MSNKEHRTPVARMLSATAELLDAAAKVADSAGEPEAELVIDYYKKQSPAWFSYSEAHNAAKPYIAWGEATYREDEGKRATKNDLAAIYVGLFHVDEAKKAFPGIQNLQTLLRKTNASAIDDTVVKAVHAQLQTFFDAGRKAQGDTSAKTLVLGYDQIIELWHILVAQADVKLLAPYPPPDAKPW